jgi:hypothetical protein
MPSDFSALPPTRRMGRPEDAGLSQAEILVKDATRLIGLTKKEPPPRKWAPAERSSPQVLALLDYPHDPRTGVPLAPTPPGDEPPPRNNATDEELAAANGRHFRRWQQFEEANRSYWARWNFWVGLDRAAKSQLCCDVQFGQEDAPEWAVTLLRDGDYPALLIRAQTEHEAIDRFKAVCGIRGFVQVEGDDYESPIVARRVEPAPAA